MCTERRLEVLTPSIADDELLDSDRRLLLLGGFNCPGIRQAPVWMID